tara:strand:+ start:704 stop:1042 length:339 start_codon:yes stop_codon:yes gene_type:complete
MSQKKFSFGSEPNMKEVPLTEDATLKFNGKPKLVETEWGEKYSFPITLLTHPSYDVALPINCNWESKCMVAKELWIECNKTKDKSIGFTDAYNNSTWKLTRFDNGSYWIDQL